MFYATICFLTFKYLDIQYTDLHLDSHPGSENVKGKPVEVAQ
jgi:hypothetical protein